MVQRDPNTEKATSALYSVPRELAEMGRQRSEATVQTQNGYFDKLQEMNREWLARLQSEVDLTTDTSGKLTTARSLPEVTTAVQHWAGRRMVFAEDGRRFIADSQKLIEIGARLFSNGRSGAA
jgi:hypothetical protein